MTEQQSLKVYELAKELEIDSISLLDKLKGLGISVKSHMSSLDATQVDAARSALGKKTPAKKAASKTKTVKAKSSKSVVRKKATPAAATATAATPPASAAASAPEEVDSSGAKPSTIIRRRTRAEADGEVVTTATIRRASEKGEAARSEEHPADEEEMEASPAALQEVEETEIPAEELTESVEAEEAPVLTQIQTGPVRAKDKAEKADAPAKPMIPRVSLLKRATVDSPKQLLKVVARPTEEEKKKAETTRVSNIGGGTATTDRDGFRIIRMDKKSLDQMAEDEAAKKRGAGKGEFVKPEDVKFADYRKKEVVFLPKKKRIPTNKDLQRTQITTPAAHKRVVSMGDSITVQDLANQLGVKVPQLTRKLMELGTTVSIFDRVDFDTATLAAGEFQFEVKNTAFKENEILVQNEDKPEELITRPPVVTVMGHVDHGKTSLLDAIKESNVAGGEAGGITQHVGAYTVEKDGKLITFIDTPGHEAFTAMRARGANVTDIVILVVAADDGVMPQTREAVSHAQAAGVPIVVAVNKIDKQGANPEKIKQELSELNLLPEEWGGQTMFIPVSALAKTNLDKLLEGVLLNAEVLDLKANPGARAEGVALEAKLDKGRGPVVTLLIKRGKLKVGDPICVGEFAGKVRAMIDYKGRPIKEVMPGMAAEILGMEGVPKAGDNFNVTATEAAAKTLAAHRVQKAKDFEASKNTKLTMEQILAKLDTGGAKELKVVLKADVFGSLEAIKESLAKLLSDKVKVNVIMAATGGVTESDVLLASASGGVIVGFNVRPDTKARQLAEAQGVEIKSYRIIYELMDDMKLAMAGMLDKIKQEKFLGRAEVRQTFNVPKIGTIAGSAVIDGKIIRGANVRLLRDSKIIYEGKMHSLKRFKDDAKEVATGFECGIGLEGYNDLKPGDVIEAFQIELITPELNLS